MHFILKYRNLTSGVMILIFFGGIPGALGPGGYIPLEGAAVG